MKPKKISADKAKSLLDDQRWDAIHKGKKVIFIKDDARMQMWATNYDNPEETRYYTLPTS